MNAPMNSSEKQAKRELSHALVYDTHTNRWSCKCGYKLGDGHHALYALCPLSHRDKIVNQSRRRQAYHQMEISSAAPIKKQALDIFDLAPQPEEKNEEKNAKQKSSHGENLRRADE
jgi:hypothetical protein